MDFLNKCIINMYCRENCPYFNAGCENNMERIHTKQCLVSNFIQWLNDNDQNISELIKNN